MFPSQPPVGAGTAVNPAALILKFGRQIPHRKTSTRFMTKVITTLPWKALSHLGMEAADIVSH